MSQKKFNPKQKSTPLRRSRSTTSLGISFNEQLNLRDTKSYSGQMDDTKSVSSEENEITPRKTPDLSPRGESVIIEEIETMDRVLNKIVRIPAKILLERGRSHMLHEVAHTWKKDCRMWLWKNSLEMKSKRSIADKLIGGSKCNKYV
ncbi:uncharacterized protein LOC114332191 [Diabrotica virgifera virgifera]|uniref:Uncharacterized protein LOC114332191 n=1 Tax=Diabrotica virgifera virgifera TaxID=50390 RepID=A0A6P7FN52_DIAVI|nr:uncharacterized protein LOC114332191 [Diabrotica virgifera virgifera]